MKRSILGLLASSTLVGTLFAEEPKLIRGESLIERPEMADGLFLHNFFQSNMVLQRDKPIKVWGWAKAGANVEVTLGGKTQKTSAGRDRAWSVNFEPLAASSDPIALKVSSAGQSVTHDNILVGDLWVLGGQSNMEFPLNKVENGQLDILSANMPEIRVLEMPPLPNSKDSKNFGSMYQWSGWSKRHFRRGYWDISSPKIAANTSAIGFVFAKRVHEVTGIPIGIIDTSIGGTSLEAWTPLAPQQASKNPHTQAMLDNWKKKIQEWEKKKEKTNPREDKNHPGNLFAGVIGPLKGIEVKGALFHQGYNNCFNGSSGARMYRDLFPVMVKEWRKAFNDETLPFCIISLCTSGEKQDHTNYLQQMVDIGAYLRDAQYTTFRNLRKAGDKNIGFVSTYDLSRRWYHPQLKYPAGERAARWALATQHGFSKQCKWEPPAITEVKNVDGAIHLKFNGWIGNVDDGSYMKGFAIAGEDGGFQMAQVEHLETGKDKRNKPIRDRSVIVLSSPLVPKPVHFRYAWARNPMGNIQAPGNSDVPLATQRSDDWDLEDWPQCKDENATARGGKVLRRLLQAEDLKRLRYEAKQLLNEAEKK